MFRLNKTNMPGQNSKTKKTMPYVWKAFLATLADEHNLKRISNQVRPKKAGGNRQDSDLVWDALESYFKDLTGEGTVKELAAKQGCGTDLQCLRMKVLEI